MPRRLDEWRYRHRDGHVEYLYEAGYATEYWAISPHDEAVEEELDFYVESRHPAADAIAEKYRYLAGKELEMIRGSEELADDQPSMSKEEVDAAWDYAKGRLWEGGRK